MIAIYMMMTLFFSFFSFFFCPCNNYLTQTKPRNKPLVIQRRRPIPSNSSYRSISTCDSLALPAARAKAQITSYSSQHPSIFASESKGKGVTYGYNPPPLLGCGR